MMWVDASNLATGVILAVDERPVEDGCWLRKPNYTSHINVAELDAAIKGINLCIKLGFREAELKTDSAVVIVG